MTQIDLIEADFRALHGPMCSMLVEQGPYKTFEWLTNILKQQRPALKSPNAKLIAYTGCVEGIDWLEKNVSSPVTTHWGESAALLGIPWSRIKKWLVSSRELQIMALDALYAYRLPAPNMSPLEQIAAPTLIDSPNLSELESLLGAILANGGNPRMRQTIDRILFRSSEIISQRQRIVPVSELPKLYLYPESYAGATEILNRQEEVLSGIGASIDKIVKGE